MTLDMSEKAMAVFALGSTTMERKDAATIAARVVSANETVEGMWDNMGAPFSRTMAIRASHELAAINTSIVKSLADIGVKAQRGEHGAIMVPDSNGVYQELDVGLFDLLVSRKDEMALALIGAYTAMRVTPKHPLMQVAAGTVGSAVGAGFGRGTDIVRNQLHLKEELEAKFIWDQMYKTGAADAVFSVLGIGAIEMGSGVAKGIGWAYDKVAKGNLIGANRALLEFLHITEEQADEIVNKWEKLNGQSLTGSAIEKRIAVLPRTVPDAYILTGPASKQSSLMSVNVSREVNKRAQDLKAEASRITNERVSAILADELPEHNRRVNDIYNSTKALGIAQLKSSGYKFDYDKLVIEPTLDAAVEGIDNNTIRKQANRLLTQIKRIGGKEITRPDKVEVVNDRRTFSELLELRELVADFGSKRSITKPKDVAMIDKMISNIDREIKRAVRANMEDSKTADAWLKAWEPAKMGMENLKSLEANVLYKAILKTGTTNKAVLRTLVAKSESLDNTYREVIQALPARLRPSTEAAVIQGLIDKFSIGEESGRQAIDFVSLARELKHIPFTTQANRDMKQAIDEMARVYKNDPHILGSTGTVKLDSFQSYLTDDPVIRLKYMFVSSMFNQVKRLLPTETGRKTAMIMATAKALESPTDSVAVAQLIKQLPPDPALQNSLKRQLLEIGNYNERSTYPRVPVYSVAQRGHSRSVTKGELGTGRYYYVDKTKARAKSKKSASGKLEELLILPDRVADEFMIREVLGLPQDTEITTDMIKKNSKLKEILEGRGFSGIVVKDTVMMY